MNSKMSISPLKTLVKDMTESACLFHLTYHKQMYLLSSIRFVSVFHTAGATENVEF